jgi:hypothetical protein
VYTRTKLDGVSFPQEFQIVFLIRLLNWVLHACLPTSTTPKLKFDQVSFPPQMCPHIPFVLLLKNAPIEEIRCLLAC